MLHLKWESELICTGWSKKWPPSFSAVTTALKLDRDCLFYLRYLSVTVFSACTVSAFVAIRPLLH